MKEEEREEIYEAMVVPKGAKIKVPEGLEIGFDVKGDLILQESQTGFNEMTSHYGSILIDENVQVVSRSINARKIVRIRGSLETDSVNAETLSLEEGTLRSRSLKAQSMEFKGGHLESGFIEAKELIIDGSEVEIGSISADKMVIKNEVKGTVMISNVKEREVDDTARIKGGFESDIELLGYLAKYRREILNEKAIREVEKELHLQERYKFLTPSPEKKDKLQETLSPEAEKAFAEFEERTLEEETTRDFDVPTKPFEVFSLRYPSLGKARKILKNEYPDEINTPPIIKVILNALEKQEINGLKAIFIKWEKVIKKARESFGPNIAEAFDLIESFIKD